MIETTLAKQIILRQKQLAELRSPWEGMWREITQYVVPRRWDLNQDGEKGKKAGIDIYDGTPLGALNLLADGLHGYLVSPSIQWFRLQFRNRELNEMWAVKQWLQECAMAMYAEFANSNFYEAMSEYFLDGASIGTATLYIEEDIDEGVLDFSCRHPGEIYIAENKHGKVDTVYRRFRLGARQAVQRFGFENLPETVRLAAEQTPDMEYEFIHATFPREDRDITKMDSNNMPVASIYIEVSKEHVISQGGYKKVPFCVWRWKKNSNETYGRSPSSDALVDIKKLNQIGRDMLWASHMSVDPALNVPQEMKGRVKIQPHGMNYYALDGRMITPVHNGINFPVGIDREERTQKIIEDHFKVEFFLMLARAEREMTATEVLEKSGEKAAVLGTTIGRLNSECLNPVIDRVWDILNEAGKLPPPPAEVIQSGLTKLEIDYLGPLAQAQRRFFRTQGISSAFERAAPIIQVAPETLDVIDTDEAMREILDASGAPVKTIRTREAVQALRQSRQQAAEEQAQMEKIERGAGVTKQLAQADKLTDGSIREQLAAASEEL